MVFEGETRVLEHHGDHTRRQQEDLDDLHNELAGRETGRPRRFLTAAAAERLARDKRGESKEQRFARTLAWLLENDAFYARLYRRTLAHVERAEAWADETILVAQSALEQARIALQETLNRAARLSDGRRVFRDEAGQVWSEHDEVIDPEMAQAIDWPPGASSYESYRARRQHVDDLSVVLVDLQVYRTDVLGTARDRLSDNDAPPSQAELDAIMARVEGEMPDVSQILADAPPPPDFQLSSPQSAPERSLSTAFGAAQAAPAEQPSERAAPKLDIPKL